MAAIDNLSWETNFLEYPSLRCTLNSAKFQFFWVHFKITKLQQLDLKYSLLATCNMWGLASGFIRMNICKRDKLKPYSILMRRCDSPGNSKISDCHKWMCVLNPEVQWIPKLVTLFEHASRQSRCFCFQNMFFGSWTIFLSTSGNSGEVSHSSLNLWKMPQLPAITNTHRSLLSAAPSTLAIAVVPCLLCVPSNLLEMSHYSNGSSETASVSNASCLH